MMPKMTPNVLTEKRPRFSPGENGIAAHVED